MAVNGNAGIAQKVQKVTGSNPVIHSDYPDPDIIRRGALGRVPTIMPMRFGEDGFPILGNDGRVPTEVSVPTAYADYRYKPLNGDGFCCATDSDESAEDVVAFEYSDLAASAPHWIRLGNTYDLYYTLDYFIGCRIGLFLLPTEKCGGAAAFSEFKFFGPEETPELP